jgi:uncharacterized SAM-binding protein YcdF (DUF218 family)
MVMASFLSKFLPLFIYPLGFASLLLILGLLFWKKQQLAKYVIILAFVILFLGGNRYVSSVVVRSLEWRFPAPNLSLAPDAIVILGGGTEPAISPRLSVEVNAAGDRVIYGAILARQSPQAKVIVSGGDIDFLDLAPTTPAQDMVTLLTLMGISQDRIIQQGNSRNTYEDAQLTCKIIDENNFSRVLLVTSAMHMPRSMMMFEKAGCTVIPAPTDFTITEAAWQHLWHPNVEEFFINPVPAYTNLSTLTKSIKEYLGMWYYALFNIP